MIQPLLDTQPIATEVEQIARIIDFVRSGVTSITVAAEFLDISEAPPTPENIRKLEALADAYPKIELFRNALGWQLLKTGQRQAATAVFEQLASRNDISADVHSSVLLGLGLLATEAKTKAKPGVKIRAVVDAAPRNFKSVKPLPPSSGKMRAVTPIDFRSSEAPKMAGDWGQAARDSTKRDESKSQSGTVFSGNLQLFALPDLLEFLRSGQRTGTLICSSSAGIGAIHLCRGRITGAASPRTKGLKEYLIAMGVITKETLKGVDQNTAGEHALIGGILVKMGVATIAQIKLALRDQVQDAVKELVSWGAGQFAFDPESPVEFSVNDVQIDFDPQEVLLNIFKEMDESSFGGR